MRFARLLSTPRPVPDLSRFVDTPRQQKDPCFNCTLPFCVDGRTKQCAFINTSFHTVKGDGQKLYSRALERERQDLIAELKDEGVILGIRGNGFIEWADDTETPEDRVRRSKREYNWRVRGKRNK